MIIEMNKSAKDQGRKSGNAETSATPQEGAVTPAANLKPVESLAQPDQDRDVDWIAEVSHELRLPIANIKLLVETLLDGALEDPETARRMLTRAQTEVNRLQHLVVNLLSVEKVASTRRDLARQEIALKPRVSYAVETVGKQAAEKRIQIEVSIHQDYCIYANPEQLDQVLLNLIENAVKFTPVGGRITIQSGPSPGMFLVEDTGIGMAASEIPKIFQRFYRIDRAQSRGSTGLGLSIVKHIADLHGAKITVVSKEGAGSKFQLEFPDRARQSSPGGDRAIMK